MSRIDTFRYSDGSHSPASNFYMHPMIIDGVLWPSNEHYYNAMKSMRAEDQERVRLAGTPGKAKRVGRSLELRPDWELHRLRVMRDGLEHKFDEPESIMGKWLLDTGDAELIEGNTWGDVFWGVCKGRGENWLGILLMARRAQLRALL